MATVTVKKTANKSMYIIIAVIAVLLAFVWQRKRLISWFQMGKAMLLPGEQMPPSSKFMWKYDTCDPQKLNYNLPLQAGMTDSCEIGALQELLNSYANSKLVINGNYDEATENVLIATGIGATPKTLNQISPLLKQLK